MCVCACVFLGGRVGSALHVHLYLSTPASSVTDDTHTCTPRYCTPHYFEAGVCACACMWSELAPLTVTVGRGLLFAAGPVPSRQRSCTYVGRWLSVNTHDMLSQTTQLNVAAPNPTMGRSATVNFVLRDTYRVCIGGYIKNGYMMVARGRRNGCRGTPLL